MMRSDNLKKHENICKRFKRKEVKGKPVRHQDKKEQSIPQQEHGDVIEDIINNVTKTHLEDGS